MKRIKFVLLLCFVIIANCMYAQKRCEIVSAKATDLYSPKRVELYIRTFSRKEKDAIIDAKRYALEMILFHGLPQIETEYSLVGSISANCRKPLLLGPEALDENPEYFQKLLGTDLSNYVWNSCRCFDIEYIKKTKINKGEKPRLHKVYVYYEHLRKQLENDGIRKIPKVTFYGLENTSFFVDDNYCGEFAYINMKKSSDLIQACQWSQGGRVLRLAEGSYLIEASQTGHKSIIQRIYVKAGEKNTFTFNTIPLYGTLIVEPNVPGARIVSIEDLSDEKGRSDFRKDRKLYWPRTNVIDSLLAGRYKIELCKFGYADLETIVNIEGNKENHINVVMKQIEVEGTIAGHGFVDLQLPSGTKWATCNIGASRPEEYGNYYAWGEARTKSDYSTHNSTTYNSDPHVVGFEYHDAAKTNWGGSWRMPTPEQFEELKSCCEWTWTSLNGVNGYKVSNRRNGQSIFLPAGGYRDYELRKAGIDGYYWTSYWISEQVHYAFEGDRRVHYRAYCYSLKSNDFATDYRAEERWKGLNVRPVSK